MDELTYRGEKEMVLDFGRLMVRDIYINEETSGWLLLTSELGFVFDISPADGSKWYYLCIAEKDSNGMTVDCNAGRRIGYGTMLMSQIKDNVCVTHRYASDDDLISFVCLLSGHRVNRNYVGKWLQSLYVLEELSREEKQRIRELMNDTFCLEPSFLEP